MKYFVAIDVNDKNLVFGLETSERGARTDARKYTSGPLVVMPCSDAVVSALMDDDLVGGSRGLRCETRNGVLCLSSEFLAPTA